MRNAGMFLGIATAGVALYAFVPSSILQMAILGGSEAVVFLSGLKYSYIAGGIPAGIDIITSFVGGRRKR